MGKGLILQQERGFVELPSQPILGPGVSFTFILMIFYHVIGDCGPEAR
jgi:hypothetical protein